MRENFDYVTIESYQADLAEQRAMALRLVGLRESERDNFHLMLARAVHAAGGEIRVGYGDLISFSDVELIVAEDYARGGYVLKTRAKASS